MQYSQKGAAFNVVYPPKVRDWIPFNGKKSYVDYFM